MLRLRLFLSALLGMAAVLVVAVSCPAGLAAASPVAAAAAADNIVIEAAGPTGGNPAVLTVTADDSNDLQILNMTVHLYSGATDVWDVTDMVYMSGPNDDQTWTAAAPIQQTQLAPGTYTMTVDAADADETDLGLATPGPLAFVYQPTLTVSSTPVSYGHQATTISGTLTGIRPGAGPQAPVGLSGQPVYLFDEETSTRQLIATTGPEGTYSGSVTPDPYHSYLVEVDPTATVAGSSQGLPLTVTVARTRLLSVKVTPAHLRYGQTGTLTGTAQYQADGTWKNLPGTNIQLSAGTVQLPSVQTSAAGHFTAPMPTTDGAAWAVFVGLSSPYLESTQADGNLTVSVPLKVRWFAARLSSFAVLTFSGCAQVTVPYYAGPGPATRMQIQYAARPAGPWKYLGRVRFAADQGVSSCPLESESYFAGKLTVKVPNAYYRAVHVTDLHFQRAVSKPLHRWKDLTRITSFSVSPHRAARDRYVTASGRLWRLGKSWVPYAHRKVLIVFKYRKKYYAYRLKPKTSRSGRFSGRFRLYVSAPWFAQYDGDRTHFASASRRVQVTVTGGSTADRAPTGQVAALREGGVLARGGS